MGSTAAAVSYINVTLFVTSHCLNQCLRDPLIPRLGSFLYRLLPYSPYICICTMFTQYMYVVYVLEFKISNVSRDVRFYKEYGSAPFFFFTSPI